MNILGVDIGGTAVKLAVIDELGNILSREEHSVCFDNYKTPILETVLARALAFAERTGVWIEGVGVSATGQIDTKSGCVIGACGNLPGWIGAQIKQVFKTAFQRRVAVMNDANCALLGEAWVGGAQGMKNVIMVTLGTGVGGGAMVDGQVLKGRRGLGGEIGHMVLYANGRMCTCGNKGCYEQYASATALVARAEAALGQGLPGAKELFELAQSGDALALDVLAEWREDVVSGLAGLVHMFNPELVLLGGGVCHQDALLVKPVRTAVLSKVMPKFAEGLRIEAAKLGNDAGMLGAVRHWLGC